MKTKLLIIIILAIFSGSTIFAQNNSDVVYLNDGSIIKGIIAEYHPEQYVKIVTAEGKTQEYQADVIKKVYMDGRGITPVKMKEKGYFNNSSGTLDLGASAFVGFQTVNGYQLNPHMSLGLGTGIEYMGYFRGGTYVPLYVDARYYLWNEEVTPFFSAQLGYNFHPYNQEIYWWEWGTPSKNYGGPMAGLSAGIRYKVRDHFGYTFSLGYRFQEITRKYSDVIWLNNEFSPYDVKEMTFMHRLQLGVGIYFD